MEVIKKPDWHPQIPDVGIDPYGHYWTHYNGFI